MGKGIPLEFRQAAGSARKVAGETAIVCIRRRTADGQGSGVPAESESEDFAGLPKQRYFALHTGRRQDSLPGFRHRKDTDERV